MVAHPHVSLQLIARHCNTLQHTATYSNTQTSLTSFRAAAITHMQHTSNAMQHSATHCNTLQYTATPCNTLQDMYVSEVQWRFYSHYTSPRVVGDFEGKFE